MPRSIRDGGEPLGSLVTMVRALHLLTPRERVRGALVLMLVILMALLEAAGVASVMPFLAVMGNPQLVETNRFLAAAYQYFSFESTNAFLSALALAAFAMMASAALLRSVTRHAINRFTEMRRHSIGCRLLETYLSQPYPFFLNRNSAGLAKQILSESSQLVLNVYRPTMAMIAHAVVAVAIIGLLVVVNPGVALVVALAIGGSYVLVFLLVKGVLGRMGKDRAAADRERFAAAGEALGAIKEIKLLGREDAYVSRFVQPSMRFARHQATNATLAEVPKFVIEALGIGAILALAVFLIESGKDTGAVLPILGLYGFAAYRLLPAAQNIYAGMAQLRFGAAAIDAVHADLKRGTGTPATPASGSDALKPRRCIELRGVSFTYPFAPAPAVQRVSVSIPVGSSLGLVGGTGAGKTTLVDILLGLLRPVQGELVVDGEPITERNLRAWQRALGYVPQEIFLTDASVTENIALGVPPHEIDQAAVERAARLAQVHDFVVSELPRGYATAVGDRGVRLSGGQRQRIGIARALYHDPAVLVFDEATSALDNRTERALMDAVRNIGRRKTIVMIAHRLNTVRECDNIVLLEHGVVRAQGTLDHLAATSEHFQRLAGDRTPIR